MLESFLIQPLIALILTTVSCSILGVFVVWQRISYLGDALSHAILLGLAMGAIIEVSPILSIIIFAVVFALMVFLNNHDHNLEKDASVMILSYFSIALAILFNDLWIHNLNFSSYIFGDILSVGFFEILALASITISVIFYAIFGIKKIMLINLNSDLAKIAEVRNKYWELSFLILLAVTIAVTLHIMGIFLTTALLVLPAAIARSFSKSAKQMVLVSISFGIVCAFLSFFVANSFNLTVGPTLISLLCAIFFLKKSHSQILRK